MKATLITGGVGFIGTNLAARLLEEGETVIVLDDLSRPGVERNLDWLQTRYRRSLQVEIGDVRDAKAVARVVPEVSMVYHFAAQTAVTTSMLDPQHDFDVNARGTLQVLEAIRNCRKPPGLLFTSTNKVYGALDDLQICQRGSRYEPEDASLRATGISEARPLDFHTPYGCSKGTADQYVLDYARCYGLFATVFRMSCIYGPHQCGTEDQGWVAHFALRALANELITIYGDGGQVRDLLFVEDLVEALVRVREQRARVTGRAFNIGGGVGNAASVLDVIAEIERLHGKCEIEHSAWRPSDQRYYVSDTRGFERATGWRPRTSVGEGIARMYAWLQSAREPAATARRTGTKLEAHGHESH